MPLTKILTIYKPYLHYSEQNCRRKFLDPLMYSLVVMRPERKAAKILLQVFLSQLAAAFNFYSALLSGCGDKGLQGALLLGSFARSAPMSIIVRTMPTKLSIER